MLLSLSTRLLCALGARDSWTANEVVKLGLTLGEDAFELSPQCKRMRLTLEFSPTLILMVLLLP